MVSPVYSVMSAPLLKALVVNRPMFVLSWLGRVVGRIMIPLPMVDRVGVVGLVWGEEGGSPVSSIFRFFDVGLAKEPSPSWALSMKSFIVGCCVVSLFLSICCFRSWACAIARCNLFVLSYGICCVQALRFWG